MSIPDPYLSQTGYDEEAIVADEFDAEEFALELDHPDDELGIEEDRARER